MGCLSLGLLKINCDTTQSLVVDNSVINNLLNEIENEAKNTQNANLSTIQTVSVINGVTLIPGTDIALQGVIKCPNLNLINNLNEETEILNQFDSNQTVQLQNKIDSEIRNELSQEQQQGVTDFLAKNGDNSQITTILNGVKNDIKNIVSQNFVNKSIVGVFKNQGVEFTNFGIIDGTNCNFINNGLLKVRVTNLASSIQGALAKNTSLNLMLSYAKQETESGNEVGNLLSTIVIIAGIVGGIVLLLAVVFVLLFLFRGSKK
jgi:hypothetical protein